MFREEITLSSRAHKANWDPQAADQGGFKLRRAGGVSRTLLVSSRRLCYCSYCCWEPLWPTWNNFH